MKNQCGTFEETGGVQIQGVELKKSERGRIVQWIENLKSNS